MKTPRQPKPVTYHPTCTFRWFPIPKERQQHGRWELRQRYEGSDGSQRWELVLGATVGEIEELNRQENK